MLDKKHEKDSLESWREKLKATNYMMCWRQLIITVVSAV